MKSPFGSPGEGPRRGLGGEVSEWYNPKKTNSIYLFIYFWQSLFGWLVGSFVQLFVSSSFQGGKKIRKFMVCGDLYYFLYY